MRIKQYPMTGYASIPHILFINNIYLAFHAFFEAIFVYLGKRCSIDLLPLTPLQ
jgi:hypothetical protein